MLESFANGGNPLTKSVLDGRKLGKLSSVIREDTKRLSVTKLVIVSMPSVKIVFGLRLEAHLIKVAVEATFELLVHPFVDRVTSLIPELGEVAGLVVLVARREIKVPPIALPNNVVLGWLVWRGLVEIAFEAHEVTHAGAC
jgi:hypothetical protein